MKDGFPEMEDASIGEPAPGLRKTPGDSVHAASKSRMLPLPAPPLPPQEAQEVEPPESENDDQPFKKYKEVPEVLDIMLNIILAALTQPACIGDLELGPIAKHFLAKEKFKRRALEKRWWKRFVNAIFKKPRDPLRAVQTSYRDDNNVVQVGFADCKAVRLTLDRTPAIKDLVGMAKGELDKIDKRLIPALLWVFDNGRYGPPTTSRQPDDNYTVLEHYEMDQNLKDLCSSIDVVIPEEAAAIIKVTASQRQQNDFNAELPKRLKELDRMAQEESKTRREPSVTGYAREVEARGFHGTFLGNLHSILKSGLQPGQGQRGAILGPGIYFTHPDSRPVERYCLSYWGKDRIGDPPLTWRVQQGFLSQHSLFRPDPYALAAFRIIPEMRQGTLNKDRNPEQSQEVGGQYTVLDPKRALMLGLLVQRGPINVIDDRWGDKMLNYSRCILDNVLCNPGLT